MYKNSNKQRNITLYSSMFQTLFRLRASGY